MHSKSYALEIISVLSLLVLSGVISVTALAQSDVQRQTIAVTYPLDETIEVKFRGTTLLPRLKGEAKIRRAGRRGTRVELSVENLPRATELGGPYTTYVLWAISPEGRVDNMGEIKRSGSFIVDSKLDVTTPLQSFSLIVTAEPHFLVRTPSRMVVLENLPPRRPGKADIATVSVNYLGNTSDYFKDAHIPQVADADYRKTPVSLLGARQAVNLARYAGAERDAPDELAAATAQLEEAENSWRLGKNEAEVDSTARTATSLGARAEEMAEIRKTARSRRDEIARRDAAVRTAERNASSATQQIEEIRRSLENERRARELAERDASSAQEQNRELRTEVARLRDELQTVRSEGENAKIQLARIEGEKQAEAQQQQKVKDQARQRENEAALRTALSRLGTVKQSARGLVVILPDSIWSSSRGSDLKPAFSPNLDPLAALLANSPEYQIRVDSYTDNRGDTDVLQQLSQERARVIADRLQSGGVDSGRIQSNGFGASQPVAPNTTVAGRLKNRRTEIVLEPTATSAAVR